MKIGITLEEVCDSITQEFSTMLKEFFTDNYKMVVFEGEEMKEVTEYLPIDEEISRSHYLDIFLNAKGDLLVRVRRKFEMEVLDFDEMPPTTRVKLMQVLLKRYKFTFKKEYLDKSKLYDRFN